MSFILNKRVHNVQTSSYKSLYTRKIFPLQPRKLFWDMWRTRMSRRSLQRGHTLSSILAKFVHFKSVHITTLNLGTKMWVPGTPAHCLEAPKRGQFFLTLLLSRFLLSGRTVACVSWNRFFSFCFYAKIIHFWFHNSLSELINIYRQNRAAASWITQIS